jgi:hypothetical protein
MLSTRLVSGIIRCKDCANQGRGFLVRISTDMSGNIIPKNIHPRALAEGCPPFRLGRAAR